MGAAVALAALSALVWGCADYSGGRAARRTSAYTAALAGQVAGLPVLVPLLWLGGGTPQPADLAWGAAAGIAGVAGVALLYAGLAAGAMAVVAPIAGVTGAVVPVVFGLATAGTPPAVTLAGVVCAVVAIGLVSLSPPAGRIQSAAPRQSRTRLVAAALAAGALFGVFFVLLDQTFDGSGLWPVAAARLGSVPFGLLLVLARRDRLMPPRGAGLWLLGAGLGDIVANALYLVAVRDGVLAVVAPVAALYPVSTVLLALAVDRERVRPAQVVGLGLAATALVLTAV